MIDAELREARRARAFDAMSRAGVDVVVVGRRDDVAELSGADGLWTAGTRPFGAACVAVASTRAVHVLSTWDAGVPPEIPFERLYGITWNPAVMSEALAGIPGFADARVVGVDAWSPGFARAVTRLVPGAEIRPVDDALRAARAVKLPGELERIAHAVEVSRLGLNAAIATLAAGEREADATGAALEAMANAGATVPAGAPVVDIGVQGVARGAHVDVSVLVDGYEGGVGRTVVRPEPGRPVEPATPHGHDRLVGVCRAGATVDDIRNAADSASVWLIRGCGQGYEPPVITDTLGDGMVLEAGWVLSVTSSREIDALATQRDLILVGDGPPRVF